MTAQERETEIEETINALPQEPTKDIIEQVELKGDVLLYRSEYVYIPLEERRRKMALITCTACGEKTYLEQVSLGKGCCRTGALGDSIGFVDPIDGETKYTGKTCICPSCGKGVTGLHVGRFRDDYKIDDHVIMSVHNVRGHLALLVWDIQKYVDKDGNVKIYHQRNDGAVLIDGKLVRVTGYRYSMMNLCYFEKWKRRIKFSDRVGKLSSAEIADIKPEAVLTSECEKSGLIEYLSSDEGTYPAAYLLLWSKYPQIENLIKQGFGQYLGKVIDGCTHSEGCYYNAREKLYIEETKKYIDWKQVKPSKMLRLDKCELPLAKRYSPDAIAKYAELKKAGERLTEEQLRTLDSFGVYSFQELTKEPFNGYRVPLPRLLTYIEKQRQKHKNDGSMITAGYMRDYWTSVNNVYGRMELSLLYPRNIVSAHDNMIMRVKEKESAELNDRIKALSSEREKFSFKDEELGLMIFACPTHAALIKEGNLLQHCVATYAKAHASGSTTIYFIRHIQEPDKPFFTLEYKDGKVQQNRGLKNCARTSEVVTFESEWLKFIKNVMEDNKNERRNKRDSKQYAVHAGA